MVSGTRRLRFLLDCDNTLLDNDALKDYLATELRSALGESGADRFWLLYEQVRSAREVVDLPLTTQRYGAETGSTAHVDAIERILDSIPFARFVFPLAFDTLRHLGDLGVTGILSDGDQAFQRRKIAESGLADAVGGRVLIYPHKEQHLDEVDRYWPADHSVLVDDKARILRDVAMLLGTTATTVHVRRGHYAREPLPDGFKPTMTVSAIGELREMGLERFWPIQGSEAR